MDRDWREYVEISLRLRAPVTVGIGVLCDAGYSEGPCVILSADDKGTYGEVATNDVCGKLHDFYPTCENLAATIAGTITTCDGVVAEFNEQLKAMKAEEERDGRWLGASHVRIAIRNARHYEYGLFAQEQMQSLMQITLEAWRCDTNPEVRRKGWAVMRAAQKYFPVWLIVGGFLHGDWVLIRSSGAGMISGGDSHYAAGIGNAAAYDHLHKRKHDYYAPWPLALVHVAEAMEAARKSAPKAIGKPADYLVIRPNKPIMRFRRDSPILQERIKRGTVSMPDTPELRRQFEAQMYPHVSVNKS